MKKFVKFTALLLSLLLAILSVFCTLAFAEESYNFTVKKQKLLFRNLKTEAPILHFQTMTTP